MNKYEILGGVLCYAIGVPVTIGLMRLCGINGLSDGPLVIFGLLYGSPALGWLVILACMTIRRSPQDSVPLCPHGVEGALTNESKCRGCVIYNAAKRELARQKAEKLRRHKEQGRLEEYREKARQIRHENHLLKMDPRMFEDLTCRLFAQMGYRVEPTPYSGDNGVDAYVYKNGMKFVIQCKRVKGNVGESVLRDLFGAMHANKADGAFVVTTGTMSGPSRAWANGKPITLIELQPLLRLHCCPANSLTLSRN